MRGLPVVSSVTLTGRLLEGEFSKRLNRFLTLVEINGEKFECFLPNPGKMRELLIPRTKVLLREVKKGQRRTSFDLVCVFQKNGWISVDSRLPNKLVNVALREGDIAELTGYSTIIPEHNFGSVRFDFFLQNHRPCLVEVKSCTLVKNGRAFFPDAVTLRGRKHLETLVEARRVGFRACILFIVQRNDATTFSPNDVTDPDFGKALRRATAKEVEVYTYSSHFERDTIFLNGKLKVEL